jgi:LMBR1 domain-containing protein 1
MRLKNSVIWTVVSVFVFGAILAILYVVGGKVAYDTTLLSSGLASVGEFQAATAAGCIPLAGGPANGCNALADNVREQVFKVRPSFVIFVIAVASILGWLLLMVMGGVGLIALPLDMILAYVLPCNSPLWFGMSPWFLSASVYVPARLVPPLLCL